MSDHSEGGHDRLTPHSGWQTALAGAAWVVAVASALGQWLLQAGAVEGGALARVLEPSDVAGPLLTIALATVGAAIVLRGVARSYGWIMLAAGSMVGVVGFSAHYSLHALDLDVPLETPAVWVQDWWMITFLALFLIVALFPDGSVASPKWRRPVRWMTAAWVVFIVVFVLTDRGATGFFSDPRLQSHLGEIPSNATGFLPIPESVYEPLWALLMFGSIVIGLGSLVTRWRHADAEMRLRLKWVLYAFSLLLAALSLDVASSVIFSEGLDPGLRLLINLLVSGAQVGVVVALGFGVLRFKLYEVELVINRTIVYGLLTLLIVITYVSVVVGIGALIPVQESALALVVTGLVAVGFAPLRDRVQGGVNRLMFGRRDDPYSVLAEMGRLLARSGAPRSTLQALTETVATSLKLPCAVIELEHDDGWRELASYGETNTGPLLTVPMRHQGEVVARLRVAPRSPGESLSDKDVDLLNDVAHQAGALVRSVRLTTALQRSRERLVLAQEEERRRIRHDLHDELGPTLASQTLQLDAILDQLEKDPIQAAELVKVLKRQNKELVASIRRLVYELRPPALDELGVAGALRAQTSQMQRSGSLSIDLNTVPDPLPDLPAAVEVAAYRIVREAIVNSVRHARASKCTAILEATGSDLVVTVADDGVGLDRMSTSGVGLTSMRERTEELGGSFSITSGKTKGTRIKARLPLGGGVSPMSVGVANG